MRTIARFMDARNTTEGKFLSVLLSVLLVFSFLNVTMFTDYANAEDEEGEAIEFVEPAAEPGGRGASPRTRPASSRRRRSLRRRARRTRAPPLRCSPSLAIPRRR